MNTRDKASRTILCVLGVVAFTCFTHVFAQSPSRIAVLSEKNFPAIDGLSITDAGLQQALKNYQVRFLSSQALSSELDPAKIDLLITPYGSAFPRELANALFSFLRNGGHWLNLGGTPLAVPVHRTNNSWEQEIRQTQFHKVIGITQSFPVSGSAASAYIANKDIGGSESLLNQFSPDEVFELYVRFTSTKDFPGEDGSAGQRDAILQPIVWGIDHDAWKVTSPIIDIDQLQGEFAGGRWVFACFKGSLNTRGLQAIVRYALAPAFHLTVLPSFACYREGELPTFNVQLNQPARGSVPDGPNCRLVVLDPLGKEIAVTNSSLIGGGVVATARVSPAFGRMPVPGLYSVRAELRVHSGGGEETLQAANGFWVSDPGQKTGGAKFTTDGTYLLRDGKPYPVTGTTYMASDVARKFLLEPNPATWDRDFADMKRAGINMVRTGLWTAWKNLMLDAGSMNETALRSLDAFMFTARKYDIPVIFTFFAFLPEAWGGVNAYLDPRSVHAQQQFLSLIAQRYGTNNDIIWDLINEPSFCNPDALWSCRPNYDRFEQVAWTEWLQKKYSPQELSLAWRMTTEESPTLPTFDDFADVNIFDNRRPYKVIDYRLFAQEMFRTWIGEMTSALRSNGNANQLITVGQDEAGTNDSPNNQFMGDLLGFTSVHNWWANDDLVWDNVVTTVPEIPNLVEETGVMFYETTDGSAWRTEEEAANLLERKLGISIGTGGAGFIEWIWNINPFMKSDNEATIGLFRVDGTIKPEFRRVQRYTTFLEKNRQFLTGREPAEVLLVLPHSNMFSTRNFATDATRQSVRALSYHLHLSVEAVSEFRLDGLKQSPKAVIVPSPETLSETAWKALVRLAERGSAVVLSGPFDNDEHGLPKNRMSSLHLGASTRPVAEEENLAIGDQEIFARYRNLKTQRLLKAPGDSVIVRNLGKGFLIWSPLPLESADNIQPTISFYEYALGLAKVASPCSLSTGSPSPAVFSLVFKNSVLYTFISETDRDITTTLTHRESNTEITVTVPAQQPLLLLVERKSGQVIASSRP